MSWTHIEDKVIRGRKDHQCGLCLHKIRKGSTHVARRGIDSDSGHTTFRMHFVCEAATHDWDRGDWECSPDFGFDFIEDCLGADLRRQTPDKSHSGVKDGPARNDSTGNAGTAR